MPIDGRLFDTASQSHSRRTFLKGLGGAALLAASGSAISACGSSSSPGGGGSKTLVYAGFGGAYQDSLEKAVLQPFEKATGIKVTATTGADEPAQLKAMVSAGNVTWDIMDLYAATAGTDQSLGLLEPIEYDRIKIPTVNNRKVVLAQYRIGYYVYSHNIWRNTSVIKEPLNSWADVFNVQQFPGKRGFLNEPDYSPEEAMLAAGRSLDGVYPIDIDLYLKMMDKVRSNAAFLDTDPLTNQVTQGDISTGDLNQTRLNAAIQAHVPIEYNWLQTIVDVNGWGIPKGAPHQENAYKLINFSLRPEIQAAIPKVFGTYSPVSTKAFDRIPKSEQKNLAGSPVNIDQSCYLDPTWYTKNGNTLDQRFQAWLTS